MAKNDEQAEGTGLGDITPNPGTETPIPESIDAEAVNSGSEGEETASFGGSQHGDSHHSGSRDVTEGTTTGTESGGTSNYRTGSGHVGGDIGNRPEVKRAKW
jgi:hypothetical protein